MSAVVFVSRDFELGGKLRCDLQKKFSSSLHLAHTRSRPSVLHGANFYFYTQILSLKMCVICCLSCVLKHFAATGVSGVYNSHYMQWFSLPFLSLRRR